MRPPWLRLSLASVVVALLLPSASAAAAERWASPASTKTSGLCPAVDPCALDHAITGAASGDEVIVSPGTYAVAKPLLSFVPITLRGVAGAARPRLVGASSLKGSVLSFKAGGALRRLALEASSNDHDALTMEGGSAEDLLLVAAGGDGAKIVGSPAGTLLRDSVVRTDGTRAGTAALKL
ncbi:MAG TPA: hypothetical protein VFP78_09580, partial [Solirubrobacteraceae bacterium]|nr:hypothetical protein [Solirubrobacteraceae bacterium]